MNEQAQDRPAHEPHWLVKAIVTAFFVHLTTLAAGGAAVVFALIGTGLLRVGETKPGLIVLGFVVALAIAGGSFALGVRVTVTIVVEASRVVWQALTTGLKEALNSSPEVTKRYGQIDVRLEPPTLPMPTAARVVTGEEKAGALGWLYGIAAIFMWWLFVPKRYRRALTRVFSKKSHALAATAREARPPTGAQQDAAASRN